MSEPSSTAQELGEQPVFLDLGRRLVAEVLVDPIRHDPADGVVPPPRFGADVAQPRVGDVPVVDHVVVVEDHDRRHHRQQPAFELRRSTPRCRASSTPRTSPRSRSGGRSRPTGTARSDPRCAATSRRRRSGRRRAAAGSASRSGSSSTIRRACAHSVSTPRPSLFERAVRACTAVRAARRPGTSPRAPRRGRSGATVRITLGGSSLPDLRPHPLDRRSRRRTRWSIRAPAPRSRRARSGGREHRTSERRARARVTVHAAVVSTQTVAVVSPTYRRSGPSNNRLSTGAG